MIKSIQLKNFLSFRDQTIDFQTGTNVLIGINGSGKSNLFKALRLFREGVFGMGIERYILEVLGGMDQAAFMGKNVNAFSLLLTLDGPKVTDLASGFRFTDDVVIKISCSKVPGSDGFYIEEEISTTKGFIYLQFRNGRGHMKRKKELVKYEGWNPREFALREIRDSDSDLSIELVTVKRALESFLVYPNFDTTSNSPTRKAVPPSLDKRLSFDGSNLTQVLFHLKHNYKSAFHKLIHNLQEVNPNFSDIDFKPIGTSLELVLEEKGLERSIHASQISDGTIRFLCLLSIIYNPNRGNLICIDEPEGGLHPDMIGGLAEAFSEIEDGSTLILSTHSESFLDHFPVSAIRVFEKDEENVTVVKSLSEAELDHWVSDYAAGQLWSKGALGAVRYGR